MNSLQAKNTLIRHSACMIDHSLKSQKHPYIYIYGGLKHMRA